MEYSEDLKDGIEDLESCALRLATTNEETDQYIDAQRHYCAVLDHMINTYPIGSETLIDHSNEVARVYHRTERFETALKRIETIHQSFLDEMCDEYSPVY